MPLSSGLASTFGPLANDSVCASMGHLVIGYVTIGRTGVLEAGLPGSGLVLFAGELFLTGSHLSGV